MPKSVPSKFSYDDVDDIDEVERLEYPVPGVPEACCCEKNVTDVPTRRRTNKPSILIISRLHFRT